MNKHLLYLGGLMIFTSQVAIASSAPAQKTYKKVVYGTGVTDRGGVVNLRVGSGRQNDCALGLKSIPKSDIVSIDAAGTCVVKGTVGPPAKQYRVTYNSIVP